MLQSCRWLVLVYLNEERLIADWHGRMAFILPKRPFRSSRTLKLPFGGVVLRSHLMQKVS